MRRARHRVCFQWARGCDWQGMRKPGTMGIEGGDPYT